MNNSQLSTTGSAEDRLKIRVQRWVLIVGAVLLVGKFAAFFVTNSVGILTDAMESIVNVVAGVIGLYSLSMAAKPKDEGHPFGHGKSEDISASIEAIMIMVAGGIIIWEGVNRILSPAMPQQLDVGIIVITIAGAVNYVMGAISIHIGKRHSSMALVAGGRHLQSDTYSTIGLVAGLILLYFTEIPWIDGALAIIFGAIIAWTGIGILRKTVGNLMDKADFELLGEILETVNANRHEDWVDIHNTKMIRYGSHFFIDCDLTLPWYYNVQEGHDVCENLRLTINEKFSDRVIMSVHSDPCDSRHCLICSKHDCAHRVRPFEKRGKISIVELTETDEERNSRLDKINY